MNKLDFQVAIGKKIRELRLSKNVTQAQLAALCNFEKSNLNRIEAGKTNPSSFTLYTISINLGVSLSEIVTLKNEI